MRMQLINNILRRHNGNVVGMPWGYGRDKMVSPLTLWCLCECHYLQQHSSGDHVRHHYMPMVSPWQSGRPHHTTAALLLLTYNVSQHSFRSVIMPSHGMNSVHAQNVRHRMVSLETPWRPHWKCHRDAPAIHWHSSRSHCAHLRVLRSLFLPHKINPISHAHKYDKCTSSVFYGMHKYYQ